MICFIGIINIIIVSMSIKKHWSISKDLTEKTKLDQFFTNQNQIASIFRNRDQIETKKIWKINLIFSDENRDKW